MIKHTLTAVLLLSLLAGCQQYYLDEPERIPCSTFTRGIDSLWQRQEGYYQFKPDHWEKFYYRFTNGGQYCLAGMRQDRLTRLLGPPSEIVGDSLVYYMTKGCLEGGTCNVQIFSFERGRLAQVHLIRPWGTLSVP